MLAGEKAPRATSAALCRAAIAAHSAYTRAAMEVRFPRTMTTRTSLDRSSHCNTYPPFYPRVPLLTGTCWVSGWLVQSSIFRCIPCSKMLYFNAPGFEIARKKPVTSTDPPPQRSRWTLSTSTVPMPLNAFPSFGPATSDGYGLCYNVQNDSILAGVSCFKSDGTTSAVNLATCLQQSLIDMSLLLTTAKL